MLALVAKPGFEDSGVGRYARMLHVGLESAGVHVIQIPPALPPMPRRFERGLRQIGIDLRAFLANYPLWAKYPAADAFHFTSQNLASLLMVRRPSCYVSVTVHDILPYMLRHDAQLSVYRTLADRVFDRLAMAGLRRADLLIADSRYTRQCLVDHLHIPADKIEVVYLGVDRSRFHPMSVPDAVRNRYGLPPDRRYLIAVGSDDPRKNLRTLVHALAQLRSVLPDVELIKVGRAHFEDERRRLISLADQLGVRDAIHFLDHVAEDDLPALYCLADVCVMPSLYEGFGFPVLEAMACGTPVVCADAASLPELVGDAALLFKPGRNGAASAAAAVLKILTSPERQAALRRRGLARAALFTWSACTQRVAEVYGSLGAASQVAAGPPAC